MKRFLCLLQQDVRFFVFLELVLMVFRVVFLFLFRGQLGVVPTGEVWYALFLGLRISLKTTALLTSLSFLLATLTGTFRPSWPAAKVRLAVNGLILSVLTFLFMVRIPYYGIFHETFSMMLVNGLKDDAAAILDTAVREYDLFPRLAGVILLAAALIFLWKKLQSLPCRAPRRHLRAWTAAVLCLLPVFAIFCRFGGAFRSDDGVHWESASRTPSKLLNEAVLDDGQALYRVYVTHKRASQRALRPIPVSELRRAIAVLGGKQDAKTLDEAFTRVKQDGPALRRPRHVVVLLGENYALWPLLPEYRAMGLARTGEFLERDGAPIYHFLANGNGTMTSLNGFLTGLPDIGLYVNYTMGQKDGVSGFGIGAVLKRLGYRTQFWYGGLRSWQDIGTFTRREGFDEFHCADEFPGLGESSSWGVADGPFLKAVLASMKKDTEDTFYFILTTSNHPPFAFDVDGQGFPRDKVAQRLAPSLPTDKKTLDQLGHIWYADDVMGKFIRAAQSQDPSTLFVVTGDHAERFDFSRDVSLWAKSGIPCFFYGDGIGKDLFAAGTAGSHLQIAPTLAELLLPPGGTYESLLPPLTRSRRAFNHRLYLEDGRIGEQKDLQDAAFRQFIEAARTVAVWRATKGSRIE